MFIDIKLVTDSVDRARRYFFFFFGKEKYPTDGG